MNYINPDLTCEERGEGKLIRGVRLIKFTDLKTYLELKNDGWKTIWTGEGKIALRPPQE
jgi:hypothetical protein